MLMAKSREPAKTKTEGTPGHTKPKVETAERGQPNPLWHQMATRVQAKLTVSAPDDPYEREADAMADRVMRMPDMPLVHRKCADCEEEDKLLQRKPLAAQISPFIQANIQRNVEPTSEDTNTAPTSVDRALASSGRPLDPALQQDMGQRFGHDFSQVRVHSGGAAEQSAQDINAHAYTVGHNIVFGAGQFAPETHGGRRLIAHELTHVIQQSGLKQARVQRVPWWAVASGVGITAAVLYHLWKADCLDPCIDSMNKESVGDPKNPCGGFLSWFYNKTGKRVPSNATDAFGHCFVGCCGTKRCGAFPTALLGKEYEFYREYMSFRPHDSYEQDTNNQTLGRRYGSEGKDCVDACRNATLPGGEMDLTAPEAQYWDPISVGCDVTKP